MDKIEFTINGTFYQSDHPGERLIDFIRTSAGLTGTKEGCGEGECGACTVLLNGRPVASCLVLLGQIGGAAVETIESLIHTPEGRAVASALEGNHAVQCGFCFPGIVVSAVALFRNNSDPLWEDIRIALSGNICRCTGYTKIVEGVTAAVGILSGGQQ